MLYQHYLFLIIALAPGLVFSLALIFFDCYKVVKVKVVIECLLTGMLVTLLAYYLNGFLLDILDIDFIDYARFVSPFLEEALKTIALIIIFLRFTPGFIIQAVILGFSLGVGFGLFENLIFLYQGESANLLTQVTRGFGTVFLHGTTLAMMALFLQRVWDKDIKFSDVSWVGLGYLIIVLLHSIFNHFLIEPILQAILIFSLLPGFFYVVFRHNRLNVQRWIDSGIDSSIEILQVLNQVKMGNSNLEIYLQQINHSLDEKMQLIVHAYLKLFLELSIRAKCGLMMRELGFEFSFDPEIKTKVSNLNALEVEIGKSGLLMLEPIMKIKSRDKWQLKMLEDLH